MDIIIHNRKGSFDGLEGIDYRLLEEILDLLENNGYIVEEEIDKIYIRKDNKNV